MHKVIVSAAAAVTLLSSCSSAEVFNPFHEPTSQIVDLGVLPPELPTEVSAQITNVVALRSYVVAKNPDGTSYSAVVTFSGVRVAANEYVTAGHGIRGQDGQPLDGIDKCGAVEVDTTSNKPAYVGSGKQGDKTSRYGRTLTALREVGDFIEHGSDSKVADVALVETGLNAPVDLLPYTQPTVLRDTPIKPGEPLYFANYEPTAKGKYRTPAESRLLGSDIMSGLNKPAILGGVALDTLPNGAYEVLVGSHSYDNPADPWVRSGASGGPVYDAAGKLAGISDRGNRPTSTSSLANYGVKLKNVPPESTALMKVVIQPVTSTALNALRRTLTFAPRCVPKTQP